MSAPTRLETEAMTEEQVEEARRELNSCHGIDGEFLRAPHFWSVAHGLFESDSDDVGLEESASAAGGDKLPEPFTVRLRRRKLLSPPDSWPP